MTATEAQVAAAMEALRCEPNPFLTGHRGTPVEGSLCSRHPGDWTDRGCPVAVQAADAVVAAGPDPAKVAADALREAAEEFEEFAGVDDAGIVEVRPHSVRLKVAAILRNRADQIEEGA
jgi:hypothetical protein